MIELTNEEVMKTITQEPVEFDKWGQWSHSAIHALGEEFDETPFALIPAFKGLEFIPIRVFDDDKLELLTRDGEEPADFRRWQPDPPKGEGWFPFTYSEDEDGPYVVYARSR